MAGNWRELVECRQRGWTGEGTSGRTDLSLINNAILDAHGCLRFLPKTSVGSVGWAAASSMF